MTDWREHNGGPQPVADDVWVEVAFPRHRGGLPMSFQAKSLDWTHSRTYRILNDHLIDAARKEGIRLGLEAAAQAIKALREDCDGLDREMAFEVPLGAVQDLNPDTIAREAVLDQLTSEAQADNMGYDND